MPNATLLLGFIAAPLVVLIISGPGVRNLTHINRKRMRMEGFIVSDHVHRFDEFAAEMAEWLKSGAVKYRVDVTDGLENAPAAFLSMLEGGNFGKQVVQIGSKV